MNILNSTFSKFFVHFYHFTEYMNKKVAQPEITCSKLAIETLEQGVKYVES